MKDDNIKVRLANKFFLERAVYNPGRYLILPNPHAAVPIVYERYITNAQNLLRTNVPVRSIQLLR